MRTILSLCLLFILTEASAQLSDREIINLKSGRLKDDSSFVYDLPYAKGKSYLFIQGANSKMSHKNELAYDFKMKVGRDICAARAGVIISMREDSDQGGLKDEYLSEGNFIIIQHNDQSKAYYWHLQKDGVFKNIGDTVQQGELIGKSGNTGYSAFPHLHFQVTAADGKEILVRFKTRKGINYLRPGKIYSRPT